MRQHKHCQRWFRGFASYRPAGEPINPADFKVEPLTEAEAKTFIEAQHYSGSYPAARFRVGLWKGGQLCGCAVFSQPMNQQVIPAWFQIEPQQGIELGRFVLLDHVPANGETWFLRRAFGLLRDCKPDVRAVLSYSDPVPRLSRAGVLVKPGHIGTIYQAHNGCYLGRSSSRTLILASNGSIISERALTKLRKGERGHKYASEQLVAAGASRRRKKESGSDYVSRVLSSFRRIRHPGNHAYGWQLCGKVRLVSVGPYPKRDADAEWRREAS